MRWLVDYPRGLHPLAPGESEYAELRIHGVGGAPPEHILHDPEPIPVSGDKHAAFYRPRHGASWSADPGGGERPAAFPVEAYSWGGLTSADWTRAFWILLLPFALANAAGWMHPKGATVRRVLSRLFALGLTVMVAMMITAISVDIMAYQCGVVVADCASDHWWLTPLEMVGARLGPAVAEGTLVAVWLVAAIWLVGLPGFKAFEEFDTKAVLPDLARSEEGEPGMDSPSFWDGSAPVRRLRRLHLAAGLGTVTSLVDLGIARLGGGSEFAVLAVASVALLCSVITPIALPMTWSRQAGLIDRWSAAVVAIGWALVGSTLLLAFTMTGVDLEALPILYPGLVGASYFLTAVQTLLVVALLGTARRLASDVVLVTVGAWFTWLLIDRRLWWPAIGLVAALFVTFVTRREFALRASFFGLGMAATSALAAFMLSSLWSGSVIRLVDYLGIGLVPDGRTLVSAEPVLVYPEWHEWSAVSFAFFLGLILLALLVLFVFPRPLGRPEDADQVEGDFHLSDEKSRRFAKVVGAYRRVRIVGVADRILAGVLLAGLLFGMITVAASVVDGSARFASWLVTASGWLVAGVPVAMATAARFAVTSAAWRRAIGSLWDVVTFFPRVIHPLGPPCYGERAVPQLAWRLRYLSERGGVVASAHSQGTVVLSSALSLLPGPFDRLRVITYGSPLTILYGRVFRAYFGDDLPDRLAAKIGPGRWRHAYAATDWLGTPLFSSTAESDLRVLDPHRWGPVSPGDLPPPILGHSTYHRHPDIEALVRSQLTNLADPAV